MKWTASWRIATYAAGTFVAALIGTARSKAKRTASHSPPVWRSPSTNTPTNPNVGEPMPTIEDQLILCKAQLTTARNAGNTGASEFLERRLNYLLDHLPHTQETPC